MTPQITESIEDGQRTVILEDLDKLLKSRFFCNSERGKQFLTYVVQNFLEGRTDVLKERVIGAQVFGRPANYSTGEDPVVRVQAGEVRKRIEQYYHSGPAGTRVQIELPTGSYTPRFRWLAERSEEPSSTARTAQLLPPVIAEAVPQPASGTPHRQTLPWLIAAVACVLAFAFAVNVFWPRLFRTHTELDRFWAPGLSSPQPILICVAVPTVYLLTSDFFDRYALEHPGKFRSPLDRLIEVPSLKPDEKMKWKDLIPVKDLGLAMGDVYAAVQLTNFLDNQGKKSRMRIGPNYTFEDLRTYPSVLIGAYNNKWTIQLTANLRYRFQNNDPNNQNIYDANPGGPHWRQTLNEQGQVVRDFGLVTRLLDSKTGQFTVTVAGIAASGTQAAAELVHNPDYFREALRGAPKDWESKNMEIVLETTVTDAIGSPPHVVATYFW
ncbi:MAG: hypothetical protein WA510_32850 [Acidobacteriaceae bacterium]